MTSDPRKASPVPSITVTLAVLLGLYVGAYYAMVRDGVLIDYPKNLESRRWCKRFLTPMWEIDRQIRPKLWPQIVVEARDLE